MSKPVILRLLAVALSLALFGGCAPLPNAIEGRPRIVATLFPQYDFARQIAGDLADITLLLPPGVESHSYEPSPRDIITINNADLFLYTGPQMEPWAQGILEGLTGQVKPLDLSANVSLEAEEHEDEAHDHQEAHEGLDPHIWTDPHNAMQMTADIAAALEEADPANAETYRANAAAYKTRLEDLDTLLRQTVTRGIHREIVFGGRFAMRYFAQRYDLTVTAAFDSCSGETEPSVRAVADIVDKIRADKLPVIYYEELADPKVTRAIAAETGIDILLLHSCHNVSRKELDEGATYLSLMEQNARNLEKGLN